MALADRPDLKEPPCPPSPRTVRRARTAGGTAHRAGPSAGPPAGLLPSLRTGLERRTRRNGAEGTGPPALRADHRLQRLKERPLLRGRGGTPARRAVRRACRRRLRGRRSTGYRPGRPALHRHVPRSGTGRRRNRQRTTGSPRVQRGSRRALRGPGPLQRLRPGGHRPRPRAGGHGHFRLADSRAGR